MNEKDAKVVARALGGEPWQSGGGIWLVLLRRSDGRVVAISAEAVTEHESEAAFEENRVENAIVLN